MSYTDTTPPTAPALLTQPTPTVIETPPNDRIFKSSVLIPLMHVRLYLYIADDPQAAFNATANRFGLSPRDFGPFHARAVSDHAGSIALYFPATKTDLDDVAHEMTHVVNYAIDYLGHHVEAKRDEFAPRVAGFLNRYIHRRFKKVGLTILD